MRSCAKRDGSHGKRALALAVQNVLGDSLAVGDERGAVEIIGIRSARLRAEFGRRGIEFACPTEKQYNVDLPPSNGALA